MTLRGWNVYFLLLLCIFSAYSLHVGIHYNIRQYMTILTYYIYMYAVHVQQLAYTT